jgi:phosphoglycolate phosphatase
MSRRYDLIAFDWDGTLWDSTAAITRAIQSAVEDVTGERPSSERASYVIGLGLKHALSHVAPDLHSDQYATLGERYRHHFGQEMFKVQLFDGVLPLLDALHDGGYWVTVATGKSRAGLNEALQAHELRGRFHGSRTADETRGKPDPTMLQELMLEFDTAPERTLMIGDTSHDLLMAAHAGCDSVGVSYGAHDLDLLQMHGPRVVVHSVRELHDWLLANG